MTLEEKIDRIVEDLVVLKADVRQIKTVLDGQGHRIDRRFRNMVGKLVAKIEEKLEKRGGCNELDQEATKNP